MTPTDCLHFDESDAEPALDWRRWTHNVELLYSPDKELVLASVHLSEETGKFVPVFGSGSERHVSLIASRPKPPRFFTCRGAKLYIESQLQETIENIDELERLRQREAELATIVYNIKTKLPPDMIALLYDGDSTVRSYGKPNSNP